MTKEEIEKIVNDKAVKLFYQVIERGVENISYKKIIRYNYNDKIIFIKFDPSEIILTADWVNFKVNISDELELNRLKGKFLQLYQDYELTFLDKYLEQDSNLPF